MSRRAWREINATLAAANGLVYHGDAAYIGPDTLNVATDDLGHNGAGGAKTDTDTLSINVNPRPPVADAQSRQHQRGHAEDDHAVGQRRRRRRPLTFAIATGVRHGALGPIGAVTCNA